VLLAEGITQASSLSSKSTNQPKDSLLQLFPDAVISGADPCWIRHLSRVRPVRVRWLLSQEESLTVDGRLGNANAKMALLIFFLSLFVGETGRVDVACSLFLCSRHFSWKASESWFVDLVRPLFSKALISLIPFGDELSVTRLVVARRFIQEERLRKDDDLKDTRLFFRGLGLFIESGTT